jgi:hypothetical protein
MGKLGPVHTARHPLLGFQIFGNDYTSHPVVTTAASTEGSVGLIDPHQGHLRIDRLGLDCSRRSTKSGRSLPSRVGSPASTPVPVLAVLVGRKEISAFRFGTDLIVLRCRYFGLGPLYQSPYVSPGFNLLQSLLERSFVRMKSRSSPQKLGPPRRPFCFGRLAACGC